jgi:cytoskeleton protein RodZ
MSDDTTKPDEDQEGPVGGERLRKARRENDISIRDVAKELHLDEHKVRALEKNEFDILGAPVFAKGHLRKYAEIVGVDVDDVMTDYYQMNRSTGAPPVVGLKPGKPREINAVPWIAGVIAVLLVAAALYWWFAATDDEPAVQDAASLSAPFVAEPAVEAVAPAVSGPEPATGAESEPAAEAPTGTDPAPRVEAATQPAPEPAEDVDEVADADPESPAEPETVVSESAYSPTPGAPQVAVSLTFSGDCWTEVTDSSGRRLFYALGQEGRVVNLSGDAPMRLILGDADFVSVTVEGRPWPIPASARRGQLARLTIPAQ